MSDAHISCPAFLEEIFPSRTQSTSGDNVRITLTWAQSIDGKIAGKNRSQVRLSGEESMRMTHWMRTRHDGIMIGIGTLLNDNPRLNVRLLPPSQHHLTPRPIVLDRDLRTPPDARMIKALTGPETPNAKPPLVIADEAESGDTEWQARRASLEAVGVSVSTVRFAGEHRRITLEQLREILHRTDISSCMVEGGASIIQQFLLEGRIRRTPAESDHDASPTATEPSIDCLIVTVAPVILPDGFGLDSAAEASGHLGLTHRHTEIVGRDAVFVWTA